MNMAVQDSAKRLSTLLFAELPVPEGVEITEDTIFALFEERDWDFQTVSKYGDPGHEQPRRGVIMANWNDVDQFAADWLKDNGWETEWCDEWVVNDDGDKCYRSAADSYGWSPNFVILEDGSVLGKDEVEDGHHDLLITHLLDDPTRADRFRIDWTKHGFEKLKADYESGWHPGQTDDPKRILKDMMKEHPDKEFLFSIDDTGQFDVHFSIWGRDKEQ